MSKGKFSNPRPYREEEREIEKSFRQLTGQEPPRKAEPVIPVSEDTMPLSAIPSDIPDEADPEAASLFSEADSLISELDDTFPEEPPEEEPVSFLEKAVNFVNDNRKIVMVAICALALVMIVSIIAIFFVSASGDSYGNKILNNVTVAGVNVGGMSKSDAIQAVRKVTDQTFTEEDMAVTLGSTTLYLSPKDTGAKLDVKAAVNAAYDYGRTGTKAEQQAAYEASLRGNHVIGLLPYLKLDTDYIRSVLEDYAEASGSVFSQPSYALEGDVPELATDKFDEARAPELTLVITMGTPGVGFDVEHLYNQILDAYSLNVFSVEAEEAAPDTEPDDVDLIGIYEEICLEPVDATVNMQTFEPVPGSYGYEFDLVQAQKMVDAAQYGEVVRIPMEYVAPKVLGDDVLFGDILGSARTSVSGSSSRTNNLKLACEAINGTVLNPGDTFSFNDIVGERTAQKGYKTATACVGSSSSEEIGGGVCQVASTLYCSALSADLEIVSRTSHSFPVSYIDYGMDADVSWRSVDFQFRNNTNYPLQIEANVSGSSLSVQILGTDEKDYYIELSYVISATVKPETEYVDFPENNAEGYLDGDVLQEGTTGYTVKTYKSKYDKTTGDLISKDFVATTQYKSVNRMVARVEVPPTEASTEPSTLPTEPSAEPTSEPTQPATLPPETEPVQTVAEEPGNAGQSEELPQG